MTGGETYAPVWKAALFGRCPRCGEGPLYASYLKVAASCTKCGLDFGGADAGDGPAVFVILFVGALTGAFTAWFALTYDPPLWLFAALITAMVCAVSFVCLPIAKSAFVALQFRNRAGEGRLED